MILICPSCTTRYTVDEAKFPAAGRTVRCAKCGHSWHQPGPEPEPAPEPKIASASEPVAVPAAPTPGPDAAQVESEDVFASAAAGTRAYAPPAQLSEKEKGQGWQTAAVVAGWVGLVAMVLLIGYSAVRYRQDIATIWPQSAGVYSGLGLSLNASGLNFKDVGYRRESEDGQPVLVVTGLIANDGNRELLIPQTVRITLTDADKRELYRWTFKPDATTLNAGATLPFRTRLSSPPPAARYADVTFDRE